MNSVLSNAVMVLGHWGWQVVPILLLLMMGMVGLMNGGDFIMDLLMLLYGYVAAIYVVASEMILHVNPEWAAVMLVATSVYLGATILNMALVREAKEAITMVFFFLPLYGYTFFHLSASPTVGLQVIAVLCVAVGFIGGLIEFFGLPKLKRRS